MDKYLENSALFAVKNYKIMCVEMTGDNVNILGST